ncbi:TIGR03668 family PPOX class F420-dependent oxidoreductase [Haloactinopolyspora sp.]|uniref:TIGR03668 family PPOX class F420-dependent oxidoreductase n=1 Tax=Haloactinopolyspora sp. TaxID=1966353 RepID=UPI003448A525
MRLDRDACRARMASARVARLATTGQDQRPHIVPITFAVSGEFLVTAIDQKPKSTLDLRRLRNIAANPYVAVLCDHYADDWSQLWWVRADGQARVVDGEPARGAAIAALREKYPPYRSDPPRGPVIRVAVESWSGWAFTE